MAQASNTVIIIGAGVAGIAAATKLLRNNFKDFIILEAENRIGGRIQTKPFGGNYYVLFYKIPINTIQISYMYDGCSYLYILS